MKNEIELELAARESEVARPGPVKTVAAVVAVVGWVAAMTFLLIQGLPE